MSEIYKFVWREVPAIESALKLIDKVKEDVEYGHLETGDYDVDFDLTGIQIRIPHDLKLNIERR